MRVGSSGQYGHRNPCEVRDWSTVQHRRPPETFDYRLMDIEVGLLSFARDPFSMGSHLLGAVLSLVATYVIIRRARRADMRGLGVGVYGVLMTLAFSASALFHFVDAGSPRYELYNKMDHIAIFLMIAGTGTAIYYSFRVRWADLLTGALWGSAVLGIVLKMAFWSMPDWLTATIYLIVGWLGSLGVLAIGWTTDKRSIRLFLFGGVAFTIGAIVYATGWPTVWAGVIGAHEVFHILVLLGAALHYGFVYRHCTEYAVVEEIPLPGYDAEPLPISLELPDAIFETRDVAGWVENRDRASVRY